MERTEETNIQRKYSDNKSYIQNTFTFIVTSIFATSHDPKPWEPSAGANSVDPDQTALAGAACSICTSASIAQWVRCWPLQLAAKVRYLLKAEIFSIIKWSSIAHSLPLPSSHCPVMTKILLKRI